MNFDTSQQTIAWFKDRYNEGSLILRPPYQRKPVWVARQKAYLIESILLGMPIPEIYIQQTTTAEGKTTYAVVDGQQRIRTVLQFIGTDKDPEEQEFNKFALDKLRATTEWYNKRLAELDEDDRKRFYSYKFAVRQLNADKEDEIREVFMRLNKFLTPLKPQELRNATYSGPFAGLAASLADDSYWAENRIVSAAMIRRMGDVEFCAELLIGVLHGPQGGNAETIDSYYAQYEDYEEEFPDEKRAGRFFDSTLHLIKRLLPNIKETRWQNKSDFYSLFVALASLLQGGEPLPSRREAAIRKVLSQFAADIDRYRQDESTKVSAIVVDYTKAVEKGANDKARRAARHTALLELLSQFFER